MVPHVEGRKPRWMLVLSALPLAIATVELALQLADRLRRMNGASHVCYTAGVPREITQRELRNNSGTIMRELDHGESFVVTRNGAPVGELSPVRRRQFVQAATVLAVFASSAPIDQARFRADVDRVLDQSILPRA